MSDPKTDTMKINEVRVAVQQAKAARGLTGLRVSHLKACLRRIDELEVECFDLRLVLIVIRDKHHPSFGTSADITRRALGEVEL